MNVDIETSHSENPLQQMPAQLVKYLEDLEKRSEEERRREIHERFRNIRCFQHILGTSTQFKLSYEKCIRINCCQCKRFFPLLNRFNQSLQRCT